MEPFFNSSEKSNVLIFVLHAGPADLDLHCVLPAPKGFASLSVDVCFLVDATGSMQSHIDNAKNTVLGIAANINEAYPGVPVRFAFIAYRDFADNRGSYGDDAFEEFDFSEDVGSLKTFIAGVKATSAGLEVDYPEDIAGGLDRCLNLDWVASNRCCILVADAPCHGTKFHTEPGTPKDKYPAGDPHGRDPLKQMRQLRGKRINFSFYSANAGTDQMGRMFARAYRGQVDGKLYEMELQQLGDANTFQTKAASTILKSISGEVSFGNKKAGGGELDVDMRENRPGKCVENIFFKEAEEGRYRVFVRT